LQPIKLLFTNKMKRNILLTILVLLTTLPTKAQSQCIVTHYDEFSGMAQWYVTQIVQDHQGMMWFATWNGLNRYDGYEFQCFKSRPGDGIDIPSDRIRDMILADDGNLLCQIEGRVFLFDVKGCRYQPLAREKELSLIKYFDRKHQQEVAHYDEPYLHTDRYGVEWKICNDGQLFTRQSKSGNWMPYKPNIALGQKVKYSTTDRGGNVWLISSYGAYRLIFKKKPYQMLPQEKSAQIRCFYVDSRQRYWITSKDDATIRLYARDNTLLGYLGKDGLLHHNYTSFGSPIYCMLQDSKGVFWLGSKPNGLFRLTEQKDGSFGIEHFNHTKEQSSLSFDHVVFMKEDPRGRLWIGTFDGGLNCVEHPHEKALHFTHKANGLKVPQDACLRIRHIHITKDGKMLVATTTGLLVADVNTTNVKAIKWHHHTKNAHRSSSLSNNATMFVAEDNHQQLYICTESGGVNKILSEDILSDELKFRHFDTSTGMPSDVALSAYVEGNSLYIVSNNQIICLATNDQNNNLSAKYDSYLWNDHLRFSDATSLLLPDGRRIFGLQDGAFVIAPSDMRKSRFTPPIALTGISIQNRPTDYAVNAIDTLTLTASERNITITFAALDYSDDGDIHYAFRLRGGSDQWNNIGTNHSATFLDLRPDTYVLEVRSTNSEGVWSDNIRQLVIIVKPTFWETAWAKVLYTLLVALTVWGILRTQRHIRRLKRQQNELHEAYLALLNAKENEKPKTTTEKKQPAMKPEDEAFMKRAMTFIEQHLGDADINIGDMAEATATSRSGLNRKMKSLLGVTPLDFIREARIRKACQMLKNGASVNDAAYSCGFSDPKYFGKCFKAEMGMTPTEYKVKNSAT